MRRFNIGNYVESNNGIVGRVVYSGICKRINCEFLYYYCVIISNGKKYKFKEDELKSRPDLAAAKTNN